MPTCQMLLAVSLQSAKVLPMQPGGLRERRPAGIAELDQPLPCLSAWWALDKVMLGHHMIELSQQPLPPQLSSIRR